MTASFAVKQNSPRSERMQAKPVLRRISEIAVVGVLGRLPRRYRREAARRYANAAWRELNGLAPLDPRANKAVVGWVTKQFKEFSSGKSVDGKASAGNDVGSPASGPTERDPEVSFVTPTED